MRMTYLWLLQLFTGLLVLVVAGAHLISVHLRVIKRFFGVETTGVPAVSSEASHWSGLLVFLSAIILLHALVGLRQTMLELGTSVRKGRIITWAIAAGGLILFVGVAGSAALLSR